jgi:hypothetical protein
MKTIFEFMQGKKTYTSLLVLAITMFSGINVTETDVNVVLSNVETIIAAVSIIAATWSRVVAKPK